MLLILLACKSPVDKSQDLVQTEGTDLVTPNGNPLLLKGVALGGWNFHETWITLQAYPEHGRALEIGERQGIGDETFEAVRAAGPSGHPDWSLTLEAELATRTSPEQAATLVQELATYESLWDDSDLALRRVLEDRFEIEGRDALLGVFQEAWFTEDDVVWLADQGFNVVRVPLTWRGLTTNSQLRDPELLAWNEEALERLDRLLDWCQEHGLYAVLDIQEAPGGQNEYAGEPSTLYDDEAMQELTVTLWEGLSSRYGDRGVVAAYSLLAEPMSAPSADARDALYDRIVQALRAGGDEHVVILHDGFRGMHSFPAPAEMGWEQVVYSTHLFEWDASSVEDYEGYMAFYEDSFGDAQRDQQVPYYIGSYSTVHDEEWAYVSAEALRRLFEEQGWSWTLWTYKRPDDPIDLALWGDTTAWGVRGTLVGEFDRPDAQRDSYEELEAAFAGYAELEVAPNERLLQALTAP